MPKIGLSMLSAPGRVKAPRPPNAVAAAALLGLSFASSASRGRNAAGLFSLALGTK